MSLALKDIEAVLARHGCPAGATMTDWIDEQLTALAATAKPVDMLLLCPACGMQHIDAVETGTTLSRSGLDTLTETEVVTWSNPPHRSHMCHGCGHQWRPADVATNGVAELKTKGRNDSPRVAREIAFQDREDMQALRDMLNDARAELDMMRAALGVPVEPHQFLMERMLNAAKKASQQSPAPKGLRGFSPRGDFAVELRFHSCRLAQAYLHDIAAQVANNMPQEAAR
ncbi:MAG: hypothetical protein VYB88_11325 [Pseudomonadota bacterium]|uniref:hypothetical protein n=1 Tax=Ralstonia pickettii TaxID=329 RepID=UPI002714B798|nr:hypothetical protein [Ralstonia pickettii]MEE2978055.1 hypothetical protein [Pseudomonadota bacterium]WKZ84212.1 hypothetical protein N5B55_10480 [Ralstonia pickettii]